jgi:hypothetical protein
MMLLEGSPVNKSVLNLLHFACYGASAFGVALMVAPSWHYGFFFTPFPALPFR